MWGLAWWPHALLHGMNPFFTKALFAPDRLALGGDVTIPLAALVTAPITLLWGPIVSYNLLMLASPALAAFFAFLLCRYVTRSFAASLVGGYLFGFSAYMLGQLLGHLHLVLIFPIPAAVHLTLRAIDGRIGRRPFIVLLALCLTALHPHLDRDCPDVRCSRSGDPCRDVHARARRPSAPARRREADSWPPEWWPRS